MIQGLIIRLIPLAINGLINCGSPFAVLVILAGVE